jgi:hypothetical protein
MVVATTPASYTLTGSATTVLHRWKPVAAAGSYSLAGADAGIGHVWKIAAAAGTYSVTGAAVAFPHAWKVPAGIGSYALTGTDAVLKKIAGSFVSADPGSYTLAGSATVVLVSRKLAAAAGSYALSGTAASIVYEPVVVAPPIFGGGGIARPPRPYPVEGAGYGILPPLEGEAFGVVISVGVGEGQLPQLAGQATGSIGAAGKLLAQFTIKATACGQRGQRGMAAATIKGVAAASSGRAGACGKGFGMIMKFEGAAVGCHNDDEAAAVAFLLAA